MEKRVGSFIVQEFPERDEKAITDFYKEPQKRKKEYEEWKEVLDMGFTPVDPKAVAELLASGRQHGVAKKEVQEFVAAELTAGKVDTSNGSYKGKKLPSIASAMRKAVKDLELTEKIQVVSKDDGVYLINKELV